MESTIVLATLSIYSNPKNMAQGIESIQLAFVDYPTTEDLRQQLGEDRFKGLVDSCEVEEIAEFQDSLSMDDSVAFQCINDDDEVVGAIVLEIKSLLASSTITIE